MGVLDIRVSLSPGSGAALWLAGIGALLAVTVALAALAAQARTVRHERAERDRAQQEASFLRRSEQARRVGAYLTGGGAGPVFLNLINTSEFPVQRFEAVAIADDYPADGDQWRSSFFPLGRVIVIPPGTYPTMAVVSPSPNLVFRQEVAFSDDNGVRWHKYGPEGLREVPADFTLLAGLTLTHRSVSLSG